MAKIRVGGENWWKSCFVFCLLRFSKHKSISTAVLFCIIVGGGSRKVFLRSFFFLQEKLEKRWNSVGFSSVNIVDFFCGFHRDVLLLLKLYTLVEEPSLDQISQALQATVFCNWKKKNQTHLSSFHFSEKWNKLVWQSTAKRGENWNEFVLNKLNLHPIG